MAKVQIKSEKITPFGGIFHVREQFSRFVGPVIDKVLGLRCTSYGYQSARLLVRWQVSILSTGQLVAGASYDLDFDHQFIETEKYDAKMTYKKFTGYSPGVAVIGDLIVGIENRDGNANVRFHQQDTLERIFSNLESNDIHIKRARMDCGSCSREIVETVEKHSEHFYIRANRCGSLYDSLLALRGWKRKEINGIEYEVNSILTEKWEDKTYRLVIQRVRLKFTLQK